MLDPENGKDYKAKLELLEGGSKLGMSGCVAFLCSAAGLGPRISPRLGSTAGSRTPGHFGAMR